MTTARQLILSSLRLLNVIQANEEPTAEDMQIALESLQELVKSWSTEKLNIYEYKPINFKIVPNKNEYTLGPGGDWDTKRPMDILKMYVHFPLDTPPGPTVYPPKQFYTSNLYPFIFSDDFTQPNLSVKQSQQWGVTIDDFSQPNFAITGGEIRDLVILYYMQPETFNQPNFAVTGGTLLDVVKIYSNWPPETFNQPTLGISAGSLVTTVIEYRNWPTENFNQPNLGVLGGTLV